MIGERIRQLRGKETQADFGVRFGISRNTVTRYESGGRDPDAGFIVALCKRYNVSANWLLLGDDYKNKEKKSDKPQSFSAECTIDERLLVSVIEAIEEYLTDTSRSLQPSKKAQLIMTLYDMFLESDEKNINRSVVIRLVKLAA